MSLDGYRKATLLEMEKRIDRSRSLYAACEAVAATDSCLTFREEETFHHHQLVEYGEGLGRKGGRERPSQRPVSVTFSPRREETLPPSKNEIESSVLLLLLFFP